MSTWLLRCLTSLLLGLGHVKMTCATRRSVATFSGKGQSVASMSVGLRASARFQHELERMHREKGLVQRSASNVSVETAYRLLKQSGLASPELIELVKHHLQESNQSVKEAKKPALLQKYQPTSGIAKARDMLNSMINENNRKLDTLDSECKSFFKKQCSLMETCRSDISSSNSEAAVWRGKVLFSQKEINICEVRLPRLRNDLAISIRECNRRLGHLRRDLKVVLGDIEVMSAVLKLTECKEDGESLIEMDQLHIVECKHPCTKEATLTLNHESLSQKLAQLKSPAMRQLVQESLAELTRLSPAPSVQTDENGTVVPNVTIFNNPPLSQTALPNDPCNGITYDAGGAGGCTLRTNPQCFNLQNKFINIQGEIVDERDSLLGEIHDLETNCEITQKTLEEEIEKYQTKHDGSVTLLAEATGGENTAAEAAKEKGEEHHELEGAMFLSRKQCSKTMRQYESELCALKKIRGELMKLKGDKHPFFQDCEVSQWEPEDCSQSCGGGIQLLRRGIVSPQSGGGAECPPLTMRQACNEHPCPIDCKVGLWSGWSACSAECGGGVRERVRKVKVHPRYDGDPCSDLSETEPCNMQDCNKDCVLGHWTSWSACSKGCGGGTKYSKRTVKVAAVGEGKCPSPQSSRRKKKSGCNMHRCPQAQFAQLKCQTKMDLVLLLDGSGSIRPSGWDRTKEFASKFVESFRNEDVQVSVILFSGPRTWSKYRICNGPKANTVDQEKICGLKMVQHFSNDTDATKQNVAALSFPKSSTWTAKALQMADAELTLGRKDAKRVVLVMTDGIPISPRNTWLAAKKLKKRARLMFGAVRLNGRGLSYMKSWGSKPTRDNVMRIKDFKTMAKVSTMNALIRDMCSEVKLAAS